MTNRLRPWVVAAYPAAFAAGYVLISFSATPTPISGLWRPLLIAVVGAGGLSIILGLLARNRLLGSLIASVVVLLLASPWLAVVLGAVVGLWVVMVAILRRRRAMSGAIGISAIASRLPVLATMFAVVTAATAVPSALVSFDIGRPAAVVRADGSAGRPNVYVLLLDGYPRSDVLADAFSMENEPFEAELESLGFDVVADSRSNYTATWASLLSMFEGRYVHEIPELATFPTDQAEQYFALMRALNRAGILLDMRAAGYRIVTVPSPFENASIFTADEVRPTGQMTSFELSLVQHSLLLRPLVALAPTFLVQQQRDRVEESLNELVGIAEEESSRPILGFVHILSPHAPMVFAEDGGVAPLPACFPERCSLWQLVDEAQWDALPAQVHHLNQHVLSALRSVVAADPNGVVVVLSDHGMLPPGEDRATMLKNFIAARTPDRPGLLGDAAHNVNVLSSIARAYADVEVTLKEYEAWISATDHPLTMEPLR